MPQLCRGASRAIISGECQQGTAGRRHRPVERCTVPSSGLSLAGRHQHTRRTIAYVLYRLLLCGCCQLFLCVFSAAATSSFTAITWAFHFIFAGKNHLIVISCWAVLVVVMLWFITKEASSCHQKLSSHQRLTPDVSCWWTFRLSLCRKYFHVLIVAICGVAVALKTVELLIFAILGALWLFIYVELIRVCCPDSLLGQRLTPFLHLYGLLM
eukprot:GHVS01105711.1.p1 GENE.GHVS01105711.1~~GHVS01105711.1.p1  ORF type:complete len:212 (-),score=17.84 GHVS01105711.1:1450-2085(-)